MTSRLVALAVAIVAAASAGGCRRDGCVGGDDGSCQPPSACGAIHYPACGAPPGSLIAKQLEAADLPAQPDAKARGAAGDFLLQNTLVSVVVSGPSHPSDLAPTGGSIIDLTPLGGQSGDQLNSIHQVAGLLPRDAVHYEDHVELVHDSELVPTFVGFVFRGHLESDRRVTVVTRYEVRACEPGVRVRSDLYNGTPDPNTLYLADELFWGGNGAVPFVPGVGLGFRGPKLDLKDVAGAWGEWPFVAARTQAPPDVAYAAVPCDRTQSAGFNDPTLTAAGTPLATTLPGDGIHLERFIAATPGPGLAPAVSEALKVRAMVHGETPPVTVTGRVVAGGKPIDGKSGRAASLLFYEPAFGPDPDDPTRRKPWSEAVPDRDGRFSAALPADRSYRVQPYAFGMPAAPPTSFVVARDDADIGDISLKASARLLATVTTTAGQPPSDPTYAELVLVPLDPVPGAEPPSLYGLFPGCDPMLGPPHGDAPACNRALTTNGTFDLLVPDGQYWVYATRGPFAALARSEITVGPGQETSVALVVPALPMVPAGAFSGDFHVHGAASTDSSIPDQDRVISFLSAGVDLVVATDHDVVTSYAATVADLGAIGQLTVLSGTEQTPSIPWFVVPGEDMPKTLGHFNFWPLAPDPTLPRNGAPWDELREPGQMMDDVDPLFTGAGVRQLNHPFAESKLERDEGFLRAIGYDPRTPIAAGVSFAADVLLRTPGGPGGMHHRNIDWDVQEVMSGSSPTEWLRDRALWFSMLSQGVLRAGTANSDTHSLALGQVGYPRNLVFGGPNAPGPGVDPERFDDDVRKGHMVGTNGPIIVATMDDGMGVSDRAHGLQPFLTSRSAAQLTFEIRAAPWIPITEIRVIVDGQVVFTVENPAEFANVNHFGTQLLKRKQSIPLSSLLENPKLANTQGDVWVVVEAGLKLDDPVDRDGDGLPDLGDDDLIRLSDPSLADYHAIVPGAWPVAFSNPFLLNLDGGGWQAPGLP